MQKTVTKKGQSAKSYSSFTVFLLCFGTFIFVLCLPGFSKITVVILHEFWFCFLHFVQFTNLDDRAKYNVGSSDFPGVIPPQSSILCHFLEFFFVFAFY